MKTTSRKRLLISSVAMLLVAMLALGTATFAWFTSSTSVKADGIKVRTSKTSKLEICSNQSGWKSDGFAYENVSSIMFPASSANGTDWFTATAAKSSEFTKSGNFKQLTMTDNQYDNKYVYANMLGIKNAGDQPIKDIKIEISNVGTCKYLRYAVVPVANTEAVDPGMGGVGEMAPNAFKSNIFSPEARTWNPATSTTTASAAKYSSTVKTTIPVVSGEDALASGATKFYNVYVWFEGQDEACIDAAAGQGITADKGITFQVTGVPVSEK